MQLIKIQDLTNRPISSVELITRYIFGDKFPLKFVPGEKYQYGDYAYVTDEAGAVQLYYCTKTGVYQTIDENWISATVPSMISGIFKEYASNITNSSIDYSTVNSYDNYEYKTYTNSDLQHTMDHITLPFEFDEDYQHVDLYIDGKIMIKDQDYYIDKSNVTLYTSIMDNNGNEYEIVVTVLYKNDPATRLLYKFGKYVDFFDGYDDRYEIKSYIKSTYLEKSLVFDLYCNGHYVSENYYKYSYDASSELYTIAIDKKSMNAMGLSPSSTGDFYIVYLCSLSSEISIIKNDITKPVDNKVKSYRMDLRYTDFADIGTIYNVYDNGCVIPNNSVVFYNSTANICDEDHYLSSGHEFAVSYKNIVTTSVFKNDHSKTDDFTNKIYVTTRQEMQKKIPVPFIDYDVNINSLLLFKESGYLVSSIRYYIKDFLLTFFSHDSSLMEGDKLLFHVLNNDYSIGSYMKTVELTDDMIENGFELPCPEFNQKCFDLMVFTTSGMYFAANRYILTNNKFEFTASAVVTKNDVLEFVFFEYVKPSTNTAIKRYTVKADGESKVSLPFTYKSTQDNLLVFDSSGMYIDKSRFMISDLGILSVTSGTPLYTGEMLDIFVVRNYNMENFTISEIPAIRNNF